MAPSATISWPITGEILDPQLSEPTHKKWPVWLFLLAASRTRLFDEKRNKIFAKARQERKWVALGLIMLVDAKEKHFL